MLKRSFGDSGVELSVVGFGGIIVMDETAEDASGYVAEAVGRGVNYFDVAPSYGNAEEMLGPALEPYRDGVFLACKTGERGAEGARVELERSLVRLRTGHVDLYQFHAVSSMEDVEKITCKGGALEAFVKARDEGLVKHIGFSAHEEGAAVELMRRFDFDSVLYPVNWVCWCNEGYGERIMECAKEKGTARLALKMLAKRKLDEGEVKRWEKCWYGPVDSYEEAKEAVRFTLSQDITAAVSPSHIELFRWACDGAEEFARLTEREVDELKVKANGCNAIFGEGGEL